MKDVLTSIVIPLVVGIIPAFISYLGARYQANSALQTVKEQQQAELQKLKEQQSIELQKLREQQAELEKLKEQQNAEIQRIREQSLRDIERIKVEMEKQAELYEKNAQTDIIKDLFGKAIAGDMSVFDNLEKLDKLSKQMQKGIFAKNFNHPANKRKKV
ncbi:hypothetical protein ABEV38_18255 [Parageobacillus thermoglucosidasius]|uniref:hypothetical protein n=1 Tax=Parageobacillus thermoglucosidasius TaxID=1426 RepID=UPI003D2B8D84